MTVTYPELLKRGGDVRMDSSEWTKDDWMLYFAYVIDRLNSWKFEAAAQLSKDGHRDLALKHPCEIQDDLIVRKAIELTAFDTGGARSQKDQVDAIGAHLFK